MLQRGASSNIGCEYAPKYVSHKNVEWYTDNFIRLQFIQLGKPMQDGCIDRENGSIRRDLLNTYIFNPMIEMGCWTEECRITDNTENPQKSLEYLTTLVISE